MLHLKNLSMTHQKDSHVLIKDLSLVVNPGDKVAIIGEEGTGKSTLIQLLVNPRLVNSYIEIDGEIINRFQSIGYLPQALSEELNKQTVTAFIDEHLDYNRFDFNLFYSLAKQFQLDLERLESSQQPLSSLSGGEKIKLQLLKLLAYKPDLLVLDEPSADLDFETVNWLEHLIAQTDQTVLFISHDDTLLERTATAILHLELLKKRQEPRATFYKGDYARYKQQRQERFAKDLQIATKERNEQTKRLAENQRLQQRVEHQLRISKNAVAGRLLAKKMKALQSQERRFHREAQYFTELPEDIDSIRLFFDQLSPLPAHKRLMVWEKEELPTGQQVTLDLKGQDKVAITGPNGVGKTCLLKKILEELSKHPEIRIGYMPQDYSSLLPANDSPLAYLSRLTEPERVRTFLASLQFTREEILHPLSALSGGQKAKLFLAQMVLTKANLLILDEPTRHLSPTSQGVFNELLAGFQGAIVAVSHDRTFLKQMTWDRYDLTHTSFQRVT